MNGILDLLYLLSLEDRDRERVISDLKERTEAGGLTDVASYLIEFIYRGLGNDEEAIARMVDRAIYRVKGDHFSESPNETTNVTTTISIEHGLDSSEIFERFQAGGAAKLTPAEMGMFVREGLLEPNDLNVFPREFLMRQLADNEEW